MPRSAAERLIEGTLRSIAQHGIDGTTVTQIVAEAGLTRAMITKTFGNKENLLRAAAERYGQDYFEKIERLSRSLSSDPKDLVRAMIRADLCEEVLNAETIAVLFVLRSIAHSDPKIREFSSTRDRRLRNLYTEAIARTLRRPLREDTLASDLATATIAMLEGFWADYFLFVDSFDRDKAEALVLMLLERHWD